MSRGGPGILEQPAGQGGGCFPCPLCGRGETTALYPDTLGRELPRFGYDFTPEHTRTYRVVLCRACRHAFCSPRPEQLWKEYRAVEDPAYLERGPDRLATSRKVLRRIGRFLPSGRLLDIGCATGDFLSAARERYQAEGLELSGWAAGIARGRGLTVHSSDLAGFRSPDGPYDLITLWGVIEHFEDPAQEIRRISGLLKPDGLVCLWTGDIESWPARLFGRKWWYIQGQHLQIFSRHSLRKLFTAAGFEEVWVGRYPYVMTLPSLAKSLSRYRSVGGLARRLLSPKALSGVSVTFALPGEMFAVYKRRS